MGGIGQDALDRLFTATLEAAIARIEGDGGFQPLVFELRPGGLVHAVAVLDPEGADGLAAVLTRLDELLHPRATDGLIDAAAIAVHEPASEAITVRMRAANYSADIAVPYALASRGLIRRERRLTLGEFAATPVPNAIFQ